MVIYLHMKTRCDIASTGTEGVGRDRLRPWMAEAEPRMDAAFGVSRSNPSGPGPSTLPGYAPFSAHFPIGVAGTRYKHIHVRSASAIHGLRRSRLPLSGTGPLSGGKMRETHV